MSAPDGRPQVSIYKPVLPRLFHLVIYGRNMRRRWSPRVQEWLFRHWPGTRTPWEYTVEQAWDHVDNRPANE